jgi:cytochrome P450
VPRFARARTDDQEYVLIQRHEDLRRAARDWRRYTSATPFRVPIPEESALRPVRQYPIETDPPEHGAYRSLIAHRFSRSAADRIRPEIEAVVDRALALAMRHGRLRVVDELALPVVTAGIAATLGRSGDADRLSRWGLHVFRGPDGDRRANPDLDAYLAERVDEARDAPGDDLFGDLARAELEIAGTRRHLTRDEMLGYGYLVLAGGRDTVIAAIVGSIWYLAAHGDERALLHRRRDEVAGAVEELLRYFSPLGFIGRTVAADHDVDGWPFERGQLVALAFAAANRDPDVFDRPDEIRLGRSPNRHVAFGHGPHTCIGAPLARMQLSVVLERFAAVGHASVIQPDTWIPTPDRQVSTVSDLPLDLTLAVGASDTEPERR